MSETLEERLMDVVIEFGLRKLKAVTDTRVVVVRETSLMEPEYPKLVTESEEIDY